MNIKCQGHSLTLVQGHSDSTFSNIFSLETARPIEAKFQVQPPWDGGTKVCSNSPGHMTMISWPPCPYMVKTFKIFFSGTKTNDDIETWYVASGAQVLLSVFK